MTSNDAVLGYTTEGKTWDILKPFQIEYPLLSLWWVADILLCEPPPFFPHLLIVNMPILHGTDPNLNRLSTDGRITVAAGTQLRELANLDRAHVNCESRSNELLIYQPFLHINHCYINRWFSWYLGEATYIATLQVSLYKVYISMVWFKGRSTTETP